MDVPDERRHRRRRAHDINQCSLQWWSRRIFLRAGCARWQGPLEDSARWPDRQRSRELLGEWASVRDRRRWERHVRFRAEAVDLHRLPDAVTGPYSQEAADE